MSAPTLAAVVVTDAAKFAALEPDWWDLWRRCPAASPFASPAWCLPWWGTFAPGRLCCVAVRREGRLVGLAPLWLEEGALGRRLLPVGIGLTDYLDVLIEPGQEIADALVSAVAELLPEWQSWEQEELAPDAASWMLPVPAGSQEIVADQGACPVLSLPSEIADPVPAGKRRKLRMSSNRLARRGGAVRPVPAQEVGRFLADLVRLHGARWTSRGQDGVLADDRVARFHEAALPRLSEAGLARLYEVVIEGAVVGSYYGLADRTNAYAYLGGFDPAFSFESPGTVLLGHAVETARAEGARGFHFLRGQEPYKYEWGAFDVPNRRRSIRRLRP